MNPDIEGIVAPVTDLMLLVGERIRRALAERISVRGEGGAVVTNVDLEVDAIIRRGLTAITPSISIVTEENPPRDMRSSARWVADPVDGTQNLAIGLPLVGASLALLDERNRCHLALAADPLGGRVLAATERSLWLRSWSDNVSANVAPPPRPTAEVRRVALLRGNGVPRDDQVFVSWNHRLSTRVGRVLQTRSPVVDLFLLQRGELDALVCLDCDGFEMPAVIYLARRLGFVLREGPVAGDGAWGLPFSYLVSLREHHSIIGGYLGWPAD